MVLPATILPTYVLAPIRPIPAAPAEIAYPEGPLLDFRTMDLLTDAGGRLIVGSGYQAWVQWCAKATQATRYAHRAYTGRYGLELGDPNIARLGSDAELVKLAYRRSLTETLLADPRTGGVTNFRFEEQGDRLYCTCTIAPATPAVGPPHDVSTWLTLPGDA
jgi:Protein of unknown function (DUF2634)